MANQVNGVAQRISTNTRSWAAAVKEMPTPVASAMYAATHAGHLGITTTMAPGMIHSRTVAMRFIAEGTGVLP